MQLTKPLRQVLICLALAFAATDSLADEYVIAILTPLSGAWVTLGRTMRNGIALALEEAEDGGRFRQGVHLSLKDYDDNLDPAALAKRTERMVHENDAILVIGPMFSTRAEFLATTANRYSFPLLTPAVSEGVTAAGPWAFRSSVSPHRLIESMTRGAIESTGARKIAVVYPAGNAGFQAQASTVASTAMQMRKLVVGEVGLNEGDQSFADTADSLRSVPVDLIFICMDAEPAGVLASRLRRAGLPKSTRLVFGPTAATPALLQVGREYVEDAIVVTDYLPELPGEQNKAFVAAYTQRFSMPPDRWAGIGYATGVIAAEAVRNTGPSPSRALMREALERGVRITAPIGKSRWTMGPHHEPQYAPAFFTVRSGAFVPMETMH